MTQERVRELLSEVADAVPPPNVAERAWRRSVRVRRRRVTGAAVAAVGVVIAVTTAVGVVGDAGVGAGRPGRMAGPVPVPVPMPEAAKPRPVDARIAGAPAWIGPTVEEETALPRVASALPERIDLSLDAEATDEPGRVLAAFAESDAAELDAVLLVSRDGQVWRLETSDLEPVVNDDGESVSPLNLSSLSPDGKRLALAQPDSVVIYNLVSGQARSCSTDGSLSYNVGWTPDGTSISLVRDLLDPRSCDVTIIEPPADGEFETRKTRYAVDDWFYPVRHQDGLSAQTGYGIPAAAVEAGIDDPYTVTVDGDRPAALVLPEPSHESGELPCCRIASWLDLNSVAVESRRSEEFRVLSWDTRSGAVRRVSEVDPPEDWDTTAMVATWADLTR